MTTFTAETFQNEFLPADTDDVDAVVTVTAEGDAGAAPATPATGRTEIIVVDKSGSMSGARMTAAKHATAAAVDAVPDGTVFAVIAGDGRANLVVPLTESTPASREHAKGQLRRVEAGGGTAIGRWLYAAGELFRQRPGAINHAILLTDGENGERGNVLQQTLAGLTGLFQCDCRGVGTEWRVQELREVATALLGTVDIVARPEDLAADFTGMMTTALSRTTRDVRLRVWTPAGATLTFVKQVAPQLDDLTGMRAEVSARAGDYPTGAWSAESRDYHVSVKLAPGGVGDEKLAARVSVVTTDASGAETVAAQALIRAVWTDDLALSTRINRQVAHYTGQAELAQVIAEGLAARKDGDDDGATRKFGRAAKLAAESGNHAATDLLAKVVDIEDAATGTVRLRRRVEAADEMALDTRSTRTVRVSKREQ
jgi:hypothetical protein